MTGRTYLLHGREVTVVVAFNAARRDLPPDPAWLVWERPPKGAPRNVAIRDSDGHTVVRGFRGLRRLPSTAEGGGRCE